MAAKKKGKKAKAVPSTKGGLAGRPFVVNERRWFTNMDNFIVDVDKQTGMVTIVCGECKNKLSLNLTEEWIGDSERVIINHKCPKTGTSKMYNPIDLT